MPENYFTIPKDLDPCSRKHCRAAPLVKQIEKYAGLIGKGKFVIAAPRAGKVLFQSRAQKLMHTKGMRMVQKILNSE